MEYKKINRKKNCEHQAVQIQRSDTGIDHCISIEVRMMLDIATKTGLASGRGN